MFFWEISFLEDRKVFIWIIFNTSMLKRFLKEVVILVVGKQAEEITDLLDSQKHVNEFIIAKKLGITINQTRNILYKIADHGLVSSIRKKDKKKGWYTYFWKIEIIKSLEFLKGILLKKTGQLSNQIKSRETKEFYVCERCNIEFNEENALVHNFTCDECGGVFTLKDNSKVLKEFRKNLNRLERELEEVNKEIDIENVNIDKKRIKVIKKIEKEKKEKRALAAAKRRATAKKNAKNKPKKKVAKKKPKKKKLKKKLVKKVVKKAKNPVKKKVAKKKLVKKPKKKIAKKTKLGKG